MNETPQVPEGLITSDQIPAGAEDAGATAMGGELVELVIDSVQGAVDGPVAERYEPGKSIPVAPTPNAIDSPLIPVPGNPNAPRGQ